MHLIVFVWRLEYLCQGMGPKENPNCTLASLLLGWHPIFKKLSKDFQVFLGSCFLFEFHCDLLSCLPLEYDPQSTSLSLWKV